MAQEVEHPADARDRLIEAAIWHLKSQPYPAVGVKALCDRAGVNKGSFYHFFASKEDLSIAALDTAWDRFRTTVLEPALAADGDVTDAIWDECNQSEHDGQPRGCIFIRLAAGVTDSETRLRRRLAEVFGEWATALGRGQPDWPALAAVHGRLLHSFTVPELIGS